MIKYFIIVALVVVLASSGCGGAELILIGGAVAVAGTAGIITSANIVMNEEVKALTAMTVDISKEKASEACLRAFDNIGIKLVEIDKDKPIWKIEGEGGTGFNKGKVVILLRPMEEDKLQIEGRWGGVIGENRPDYAVRTMHLIHADLKRHVTSPSVLENLSSH